MQNILAKFLFHNHFLHRTKLALHLDTADCFGYKVDPIYPLVPEYYHLSNLALCHKYTVVSPWLVSQLEAHFVFIGDR